MTSKAHDSRSRDYHFTSRIDGISPADHCCGGLEATSLVLESLLKKYGNRLTITWTKDSV